MPERRIVWRGRHIEALEVGGWEYVQRRAVSGIVVIVAVTQDDKLLFVEQHRPPVDRRVIELPAGLAGDLAGHEDEELTAAAGRELIEETGYEAATMRYLMHGPPSAGLSNELLTFVRADGLKRVGAGGGDASEDIAVHEVPLAGAHEWLAERAAAGVLVDPKVYTGLYFAARR